MVSTRSQSTISVPADPNRIIAVVTGANRWVYLIVAGCFKTFLGRRCACG